MTPAASTQAVWLNLTWLRWKRREFRFRRAIKRILSPRRIVASSLTIFFVVAYLLNGIYILSARQPADPERLMLWLSGGMVIYGIYYGIRCAWSPVIGGFETTPAEDLWLGGAPIGRTTRAINHVVGLFPPAMAKTLLLAVVLARDVHRFELMFIGVLTSLLLLEITRTTMARWSAGLTNAERRTFRVGITSIAMSAVALAIASIGANTPVHSPTWVYALNVFLAIGQVAACDVIQWLSMPWIAPAQLAVAESYTSWTVSQLLISLVLVPLATCLLVGVDRWSDLRVHRQERNRLESGQAKRDHQDLAVNRAKFVEADEPWIHNFTPERWGEAISVAGRHWVSVKRYRWMILGNFIVPILLCLSPLLTGQAFEQWLYVVGGVALCTMLLAPPALKIDFRRDLRRMLLVKSLPVAPQNMVIGTLLAPVLITWVFQWITIAIGAWITAVQWNQIILWIGMMNALAVFTFAGENALFLAYPHHEKAEGIGMMIRAKLTFLGKGTVLAIALTLLVLWSLFCRMFSEPVQQPMFVTGAIAATWLIAAISLKATTLCWRRFDLSIDIPPQ